MRGIRLVFREFCEQGNQSRVIHWCASLICNLTYAANCSHWNLAVIKENSCVTLEAGENAVEYNKDKIRFRLTSF